jgi:hypothetical protein
MSHVSIDIREHGVSAPRRHQKAEGDGKREPVRWEEVGLGWLAKGPGGLGLDEAVDEDDEDN